jgi:flagellar protein FlbD
VIILTRLGVGLPLAVNPDLIERAESTPDTVITLVDGSKLVVVERLDDVLARVRTWRAAVVAEAYLMALQPPPDGAAQIPEPRQGRPRLHLAAPPPEADPEPDDRDPDGRSDRADGADGAGAPRNRAVPQSGVGVPPLAGEDLDALAAQSTLAGLARALRLPRKG